MRQLRHQLAAACAAADVHVYAAQHIAPRFALRAQIVQAHDACCGPGPARFHAFAYPYFFLRQQLVGARIDHRLLR